MNTERRNLGGIRMKNCETLKRDKNNIALNLYNHLQEANKTIEDVAFDLGVSTRSIYHWTSGERIPDLDNLIGLANYLSIKVDDLLA